MSALCGIYSPANPRLTSPQLLQRMLGAIKHRGGDYARQHVDEQSGLAVAASFHPEVRGDRTPPNWYEDPAYLAAVDGHIHNWRSLLDDSAALTTPESAAAVALIRDNRSDFPGSLDGSFALMLWDKRGRELWLARDPLGRKPLYYSILEAGAVLFASEPKALLEYRTLTPNLNREAFSAYITFGCVPAPVTLFNGINKLFPGEALRVDSDGVVDRHQYWQMPPFDPYAHTLADLAGPIREGLMRTLEKQLRNAERVGIFLSGGPDSTILLGTLKLLGIRELHSFTLSHSAGGLQVDNRADCDWARSVASLYGSTHHVIDVDAHPAGSARTSELLLLFDDPLILENRVGGADLLARAAAEIGVEVCVSGNNQSAFGGVWEWKALREMLAQDSGRHRTPQELVIEANSDLFYTDEQCALLGTGEEEVKAPASLLLARYLRGVNTDNVFDLAAAATMLMRSPEQFTAFEERVSVLRGVEVCYPYFDPSLLRVANGIPSRFRESEDESTGFAALRWAFRDVLPHGVVARPKLAYPRDIWTDGRSVKLREMFLSPEALGRSGVFEPDAVRAILSASEDVNNIRARRQLWTLLFFQIWFYCYLSGDGVARLDEAFSGP